MKGGPKSRFTAFGLTITALVGAVIVVAIGVHWILAWVISITAATFGIYGVDKLSARTGQFRVPDNVAGTIRPALATRPP